MSRLFLDYNAGALDPGGLGNPNGLHEESRHADILISRARDQVANLVGADPSEIFFFPSASLVNYFLITSFARVHTSPFEHPSVIKSISEFDSKNPTLVSCMLANNETGEIYNIEHFFSKFPNAKKHSDVSQAVGKIPVNLTAIADKTGLDFATISAQKIGGGKGSAALYIRGGKAGLKATTALKYRLFALGTPNAEAIRNFGAAADRAAKNIKKFKQHIRPMRDNLRARIQAEIPNIIMNTPAGATTELCSLPNTLDVSFPGAEGESIMLMLDAAGIATSTGSACATMDGKPSHVLMAMHKNEPTERAAEIAHGSIRFSFPPNAPPDTVDRIMNVLPNIIANLRAISTEVK